MQICSLSTTAVLLSLSCRSTAFEAIARSSSRAATPTFIVGSATRQPPSLHRRCCLLAQSTKNKYSSIIGNTRLMSSSSPNNGDTNRNDVNEGLTDIGTKHKSSKVKSDPENTQHLTWKQRMDISIAKSRKIRGSNYVQISTIDYETMEPRCRTVVFRGFVKDVPFDAVKEVLLRGGQAGGVDEGSVEGGNDNYDCVMKMITDKRSNKVKELGGFHGRDGNANSVEMVWWFPKSSEQYRVRGKLQFIGNDGPLFQNNNDNHDILHYFQSERKQQWGNLSDPAREQFYWKDASYLGTPSGGDGGDIPPGGRDDEGKVLPPPDSFLLMLLYPTKVDYLRLGDNFRQVDEWDWGRGVGEDCRWKSL